MPFWFKQTVVRFKKAQRETRFLPAVFRNVVRNQAPVKKQVLSNIQAIPVWCDSLIPFKCFDKIAYIAKTTSIGNLCQG